MINTKKIAVLSVAALLCIQTYAQKLQEKDVPVAVKSSLQKQYPIAKQVKWEKEGPNFEAEFKLDKVEYSVVYDELGNTTETEVQIETGQLPSGILDYIKTNHANHKIKESAKITDAQGTFSYEVELKEMELLFNSNGGYLGTTKKD
ncbi:MAG TPA: PepSY-like domain-containing protein [Agriterribacter sp.]|nr:PepSY-like domain-containing protein [Agriterribacter sp.]